MKHRRNRPTIGLTTTPRSRSDWPARTNIRSWSFASQKSPRRSTTARTAGKRRPVLRAHLGPEKDWGMAPAASTAAIEVTGYDLRPLRRKGSRTAA